VKGSTLSVCIEDLNRSRIAVCAQTGKQLLYSLIAVMFLP